MAAPPPELAETHARYKDLALQHLARARSALTLDPDQVKAAYTVNGTEQTTTVHLRWTDLFGRPYEMAMTFDRDDNLVGGGRYQGTL